MNARVLEQIQFRRCFFLNPKKHLDLNTQFPETAVFPPRPDYRSTGRSTEETRENSPCIPVDRPVDPEKPRIWVPAVRALRSTGPVDRPKLCACCARRSTGLVDRPACLLLLLLFPAAFPLPFIVDFLGDLRRHLAIFYSTWHGITSFNILSPPTRRSCFLAGCDQM